MGTQNVWSQRSGLRNVNEQSCNLVEMSCNVKITVNHSSLGGWGLHLFDKSVESGRSSSGRCNRKPTVPTGWSVLRRTAAVNARLWMPTIYRGRVGSDLWLPVRGMMHGQDVRLLPLLMPIPLHDPYPLQPRSSSWIYILLENATEEFLISSSDSLLAKCHFII